jgi:serine/threonine-protein kinase HipA
LIRVWTDNQLAGVLDRLKQKGSTFAYDPKATAHRAASLTMPVRTASWNQDYGILPIFEMNLPEGILKEQLRNVFAKALGTFDDFDVLTIVGRSQIGRIRYTAADAELDETVPFQSVDEILAWRREGTLFQDLIARFARFSGISGVQPKVLIRDEANSVAGNKKANAPTVLGATHIVKFWSQPLDQLAANENFCMRAAQLCGLEVPRFRLSESADVLVVDRFDLRQDGNYSGLEDFCVLNGVGTGQKYNGGYETKIFGRLKQYLPLDRWPDEAESLFRLFVLNCAIRNGDAHLKNFAVIYDDVTAAPKLAPVYDLVTTVAYNKKDQMALTLDGSPYWPTRKQLEKLGATRCGLSDKKMKEIFESTQTGTSSALEAMHAYANDHPAFAPIAETMSNAWTDGIASLKDSQ